MHASSVLLVSDDFPALSAEEADNSDYCLLEGSFTDLLPAKFPLLV